MLKLLNASSIESSFRCAGISSEYLGHARISISGHTHRSSKACLCNLFASVVFLQLKGSLVFSLFCLLSNIVTLVELAIVFFCYFSRTAIRPCVRCGVLVVKMRYRTGGPSAGSVSSHVDAGVSHFTNNV